MYRPSSRWARFGRSSFADTTATGALASCAFVLRLDRVFFAGLLVGLIASPQHAGGGVQELLDFNRLEHDADVLPARFVRRFLGGVTGEQGCGQCSITLSCLPDDLAPGVPLFQGVIA